MPFAKNPASYRGMSLDKLEAIRVQVMNRVYDDDWLVRDRARRELEAVDKAIANAKKREKRSTNPFARFKDFKSCKRSVRKRGVIDPAGYCATIARSVYGKEKLQKMAARAKKARAKRNPKENHPDSFEMVEKVAKGFHGRLEGVVTELLEEERYAENLAQLGYMEDMEVAAPSGSQIISFPDLPLTKRPVLCSSGDRDQLYLIGGKQVLSEDDLEALGLEWPQHDYLVIGEVEAISYITAKYHLARQDRKMGPYRHEFGDEGGELPILIYDAMNDRMYLMGGSYVVEDEGIRN